MFSFRTPRTPRTPLILRRHFRTLDRRELELRARALAHTVPLGDAVLCRVLGRYKMYIDAADDGFGAHVMLDGVWEGGLTIFMAREIQDGMRVVDAGANHGYYTILFADLVGPKGRVAAIEPNPRMMALLRRSVAINGFTDRVEPHEQALGARDDEEVVFWTPTNEPKNARVISYEHTGGTTFPIRSMSLATLMADWPRVDFIKIDVEGAEEAMLEGAWPIIVRDHPRMLLEFNPARCLDPPLFWTD
jgi:FkbM family methyltransferase